MTSRGLALNTNLMETKYKNFAPRLGIAYTLDQDNRCLRCERALSSFDTPHRFVFGTVYELPVGGGRVVDINNPVASTLIGGWQLSGGITLSSCLLSLENV